MHLVVFLTIHYTDFKMVQFTWGGHIGSKSQIWLWNKNPFVCLLVRKTPQQLEIIIPHHLSFIIHPSSFFNHPSSFFINPSFILQLFNFLAYCSLFENVPQNQCYQWNVPIMTLASWDHFWVKLTCKRYVKGCLKVQDVQKKLALGFLTILISLASQKYFRG